MMNIHKYIVQNNLKNNYYINYKCWIKYNNLFIKILLHMN